MKRFNRLSLGFFISALFGCTTTVKNTGSETQLTDATSGAHAVIARNPAMHIYAGYSCSSGKFDLDYDGPGSNYAVGGYGHLYKKVRGGKKISVMSWESGQDGEDSTKIGDKMANDTVGLIFSFKNSKQNGPQTTDTHSGDKCTPGERDYQHIESSSKRVVEVGQVSTEAVAHLGVKTGEILRFVCRESEDMPITCPSSGVYGSSDLAN